MRPFPCIILAALLLGAAAPLPHGFLGLEFAAVTRAAAARAPLLTTRGALIAAVVPDSPAALGGIRQGEIIAAIDGEPVVSAQDAAQTMAAHKAGDRVTLTLIDITRGNIYPHHRTLIFAAAPPVTRNLSVLPPRLLAREARLPSSMAANAAWSRRMRGAVNPLALMPLHAGQCSAFAPEDWTIFEARRDVFHLASADGRTRAIYKRVALSGNRSPRDFALGLLAAIFKAAPQTSLSQEMPHGFRRFDFGTDKGVAGFVVYHLTPDRHLSLWIAAGPADQVADQEPITAAVVFSVRCAARLLPLPRAPEMASAAISVRCQDGRCAESDFAAAGLERFRLGYVHNARGDVFLINPRRDLWATGPEGPGYYRQMGGENEKLEPGRTN